MNTPPDNQTASRRRSWVKRYRVPLIGLVLGLSAVSVVAYAKWFDRLGEGQDIPVFATKRGPLTINVSLKGTINNRDLVVLKSEVEGRTTILTLIPEGTDVEVGDVLVELDASTLADALAQQQITVQNSEASFIRAEENQKVTLSQGQSDIAQAELAYRFAQLDRDKYVAGEYPRQIQKAQSDITIATEELERASDKLEWSRQLAEEGYITQTELLADELAMKRSRINLDLAQTDLKLLEQFTHERDLQQLNSDVEQTLKTLERATLKASANDVQAAADFAAKESEFQRQQDKEEKIREQITKCTITAPVAGMVVYATTGQGSWRGNAEPLAERQEIREMQPLIHLPTTASMKVDVRVPEASLQKIASGMFVRILVESLPGQTFTGRVGKIALLPDAITAWLSPDLTAYSTEIYLDGDSDDLRPGMTCRAEIIVAKYDDTLYVPVQSVIRVRGPSVVYVKGSDGPEMREVTVGLDNNRMIRIVDGLTEGQEVLLDPPLAESVEPDVDEEEFDIPELQPGTAQQGDSPEADKPAAIDFSKVAEMTPEERRKWYEGLTPAQREEMQRMASQMGGGQGGGQGGGTPGGEQGGRPPGGGHGGGPGGGPGGHE